MESLEAVDAGKDSCTFLTYADVKVIVLITKKAVLDKLGTE